MMRMGNKLLTLGSIFQPCRRASPRRDHLRRSAGLQIFWGG
jgi:hypothetical protein